jgi:hypothetical protein
MANSQQCSIVYNNFISNRYSVALECCINFEVSNNFFLGSFNAGLGLLMTSNTSHVYYGSLGGITPNDSITKTFWNDSPLIMRNLFSGVGSFGILDYGSSAEGIRDIENNVFYTNNPSPGLNYGYCGRNAESLRFVNNWFENTAYPIASFSTNAAYNSQYKLFVNPTYQPSGTLNLTSMPDGYGYSYVAENNHFANTLRNQFLDGVTGQSQIGTNIIQGLGGGTYAKGISDVVIGARGSGYTNGAPLVFSGGSGSGAAGYVLTSGGEIIQCVITNPGSGYTVLPTVSVAGGTGASFTVYTGSHIVNYQGRGSILDMGESLVSTITSPQIYKITPYNGYQSTANLAQNFTTYTPTITSSSGTLGNVSVSVGRWIKTGNLVFFSINYTITDIGTASGAILFSLPTTANVIGAGGGSGFYGGATALAGQFYFGYLDRMQFATGRTNLFDVGAASGNVAGWYYDGV